MQKLYGGSFLIGQQGIKFSCTFQKAECLAANNVERRHPSSSFVDGVMVALTTQKEEDVHRESSPGAAGKHSFSHLMSLKPNYLPFH